MLARKIIESLNVSPIYFIVAFNLSQNLSLIAGICIYDCKPIHLGVASLLFLILCLSPLYKRFVYGI